jgi:hypothetical protein
VVGYGLPVRPIPLDVLRSLLLHPSMGFDARDAALTWLVGRAQAEGGAWPVGLAGCCCRGSADASPRWAGRSRGMA